MNITVHPVASHAKTGTLTFNDRHFPCALGRGGIVPAQDKREGDGATPAGTYPLREVWIRRDKFSEGMPTSSLPTHVTSPLDGWSDDILSPNYNRHIQLELDEDGADITAESHEVLWRKEDDLYDLIIPIGYNDEPAVPEKGSAIFIHVAREEMTPTAGCIALKKSDLVELVKRITPETQITIEID